VAVNPPPRFPLAVLPTPLVPVERLARAAGGAVWIKRDDLTGFALGGNKARKLEYTVGEALRVGADVLVTGGGPRSNHVRATAAAAAAAGLGCEVVLYGEPPAREGANLALVRAAGARVRFTGDPDRSSVDRELERVARELEGAGARPYVLPRGGATPAGAYGYALAARELAEQLEAAAVEPAAVVVAVGSCGTLAGLAAGASSLGLRWRLVGASVSREPAECRRRTLELARACAVLLGGPSPSGELIEIVDARGPGYGAPSAEGRRAAQLAARTEGLFLDPTFTAKAMAVVLALLREGLGGPAVFIHTGGEVEAVSASSEGAFPAEVGSDRGGGSDGGR
jgi:D-cysteine desulfhydrase